jgi:hypothetical protein
MLKQEGPSAKVNVMENMMLQSERFITGQRRPGA